MDWLIQHKAEIAAAGASFLALISVIVGLTPSTKDDTWLRKAAEWISLLSASNHTESIFSLPGTVPDRWVDAEEYDVDDSDSDDDDEEDKQ